MGNKQYKLVGAPRFELGTSCAQASRATSWKSFFFNLCFENKRVRKIFSSGTMYRNVAPHAWSPLNFHHGEQREKRLQMSWIHSCLASVNKGSGPLTVDSLKSRCFKSGQRNQSYFAFNHFRKPCNHPNLYFAA